MYCSCSLFLFAPFVSNLLLILSISLMFVTDDDDTNPTIFSEFNNLFGSFSLWMIVLLEYLTGCAPPSGS